MLLTKQNKKYVYFKGLEATVGTSEVSVKEAVTGSSTKYSEIVHESACDDTDRRPAIKPAEEGLFV